MSEHRSTGRSHPGGHADRVANSAAPELRRDPHLIGLQRTAGNQAVDAYLQRSAVQRDQPASTAPTPPAQLDSAFNTAVAGGNWAEAATQVNGFDDAGILS